MTDLVLDHYGYKKEDTVMLLDTKKNMKKKKFSEKFQIVVPTRDNIVRCFTTFTIRLTYRVCNKQIREISNLVKGAKPGDHFFFHCTCMNLFRNETVLTNRGRLRPWRPSSLPPRRLK